MWTNITICLDYFFLLTSYTLFYVASGSLRLSQRQLYNPPIIYDDFDFISKDNPKQKQNNNLTHQTWLLMQSFFYNYFPYVIILFLIFASSMLNGRSVSDITSSIYLYFALKFIINNKKLFTRNTKYIKSLRTYNRLVLTLLLIYQCPFFICPSAVDINGYTEPDYITTEDCSLIMHKQQETQSAKHTYEAKQPMQLYIILSHSLGLLKMDFVNMTYISLFFITELQYQLF